MTLKSWLNTEVHPLKFWDPRSGFTGAVTLILIMLVVIHFLLGCALQPRQNTDTTKWAEYQDSIFVTNERDVPVNHAFDLLYKMQEHETPTNLTLRESLLRGDTTQAKEDFHALTRNGYWVEGYSYWRYACDAIYWYNRTHLGAALFDSANNAISANYNRLISPDGTIPLMEVSLSCIFTIGFTDEFYEDSSYIVVRNSHYYLLISKDNNPNPKWNLHHHLDNGYVALWMNDKWAVRCDPYLGFDRSRIEGDGGLDTLLPKGGYSSTWRVSPMQSITYRNDSTVVFLWRQDGHLQAVRQVTWTDTDVVIKDDLVARHFSTRTWNVAAETNK